MKRRFTNAKREARLIHRTGLTLILLLPLAFLVGIEIGQMLAP